LVDDGYEVSIRSGHVVVDNVPYVTPDRSIARGALISVLELSGDRTSRPSTHVMMFTGEHHPCHATGRPIEGIIHDRINLTIDNGLIAKHSFSSKPPDGYADYYAKFDTYAKILSAPAVALDSKVTPRTFRPSESQPDSPHCYPETASGRAGIADVMRKLYGHRIAIVGLGGTGAYVLDFLAKTPVREIHLFDFDRFFTHNAYRAPGAASLEVLREGPTKVAYLHQVYCKMHRGIIPHDVAVDESNLSSLEEMDFVFICIDDNGAKGVIASYLESRNKDFIDVGVGVELYDGYLGATVRVTTSTTAKRDHFRKRVPMGSHLEEDAYRTNIQIAELNGLNACLAVIRWKKLVGFYRDLEREHSMTFSTDVNLLVSEDTVCE